ncbi:conserved hypothetical protein [Talaromyces stipitatus ATCC 10500]|uniref:Rhodopsin domain-containing protein n=1 Tax=Talaromyces stipitatus (strain ATCC 10500 / CBS 375.48 / QM 6759 / NRRL 1006) TaxID=441959 RepID=B8M5A6_TALSN|nr:uncharacterized protein TSTA_029840 [Talaromyces stipitatus ATCC 10500]EED19712.1 conserved hypothetical protein [Talaromyces stipitatus ATCC 10500]
MSSPASASSEHSPEWLAENKGANILAPMWALTMITTSTVIARIYIRVKIVKNVGFDDWAIVVGLIFGLVYLGITTANVVVGYGRHADALDLPHLEKAILLNTIGFVFGILSFTIPKIAVAIMLTRILNPSKFHKYFIFSLVGFTASVAIVCILLLMTECDPPAAQWDKSIKNATCRDIWILIDFAVFTGALSAFVDLYLAIYPSVVLWKLNMSVKKRLALMGALGLGSIAAAMAVIKCTQLKGLADAADYTFGTWQLVIWTNIEADIVVIASCIPTLQPLLEYLVRKSKGTSYNNKYFNRLEKDSSGMHNSQSIELRAHRNRSKQHSISITNIERGDGSQESILPPTDAQNAIRRTDNVTINYETRSDEPASKTREW